LGGGESDFDENPFGSTNLSGTNLDSRRLALERAARKGEAHGWAEQSRALCTPPTNSSGPNRYVELGSLLLVNTSAHNQHHQEDYKGRTLTHRSATSKGNCHVD